MEIKERQQKGETVDVAAVQDPEAREIITDLLRRGGARIQSSILSAIASSVSLIRCDKTINKL
jgi:hypothetical protein